MTDDVLTQMIHASVTLSCCPGSKIAAENMDVFANAWSVQINDLSVLVKDVNESCHGKTDHRQVYLSLPRPGVSYVLCLSVCLSLCLSVCLYW